MDVLFAILGNEERGSTRFRVLNMLPFLHEAGMETDVLALTEPDDVGGPWPVNRLLFAVELLVFATKLLARAPRYDAVYLQKIPPTAAYIRLLSLVAEDVVYDFDDALHTTKPWSDQEESRWRGNLDSTLESVSLVATGSPHLAEYAGQFNDNVVSLPTPMPRWPYQQKRLEQRDRPTDDGVTFGWIGYPENLHYLAKQADALATVLDEYEEAELWVITSPDLPVAPLADRDDVRYLKWSLEKQIDYPAEADVGIRPLTDDEWTRSKNFASVNQFMALAKPVVVTPVGMLEENVEHGVSGFHAETEAEWIEYLSLFLEDPERREEMGKRALQAVGDNGFWLDQRAEELIGALRSLQGGTVAA